MNAEHLNLRHLRSVLAVARRGSISAAAREIHLTQPAITQGIAKLEATLGQRLFDRRSDGMAATPAALKFAGRIERALGLIKSERVTATQVRAFLAVAKAGSYAGASRATGLREASLHRAVADLSIALGHPLFERRHGRIIATAEGERAARRFGLARAELAAGLDEMAAETGRETGHIAIGAMPLSRARLLPRTLAGFSERFPDSSVTIVEGSHGELLAPLRNGDVDLLVGALRFPPPARDLHQIPLFEDRPIIIGRAGHPLAGTEPDLATMARYPWTLAGRGTPLREHWEQMFDAAGISRPRVPVECGSVMTIRQLLRDSDFLTLLSPDQVSVELDAGLLTAIGLAPEATARVIGLTTRADWFPTALQRAFIAELTAASAESLS
ncbi:LysR substrate-binding domain-containing protein [Flavisphingomonas formosensis]|uniref:LysR substrate-binding domain-containing protein n=1 Tax=Flavisphingomonas formosensis TaxID=861534 RepID=UPI0012F7A03E|nr:LysR substrate-binding domain-containing protein [Sphingomonas formosensis]